MQRFALPIVIAITALLIGIGIGRYTFSSSEVIQPRSNAANSNDAGPATSSVNLPPVSEARNSLSSKSNPAVPTSSTAQIIARIKDARLHSFSRHTYATFSKLAETVDASNIREVLAFVETLPPQEKSVLVALFVGRWAEFDPSAAIAYAQSLPAGTSRNWALTSAVTGWAEKDPAAATAWGQPVPLAPGRDQD